MRMATPKFPYAASIEILIALPSNIAHISFMADMGGYCGQYMYLYCSGNSANHKRLHEQNTVSPQPPNPENPQTHT